MREEKDCPEASSQLTQGATQRSHLNTTKLLPRVERLAHALLDRPHSSWELIHIIQTTNAHEYIRQLRHDHGLEVAYESVKFTTVDGKQSSYNLFYLTPEDRTKLQALLDGGTSAGASRKGGG